MNFVLSIHILDVLQTNNSINFLANLINCFNFEVNVSISFSLINLTIQFLVGCPEHFENEFGEAIDALLENEIQSVDSDHYLCMEKTLLPFSLYQTLLVVYQKKLEKGLMFQWVTYFLGPAQVHNPLSYSQTELSAMIKTLGPSK